MVKLQKSKLSFSIGHHDSVVEASQYDALYSSINNLLNPLTQNNNQPIQLAALLTTITQSQVNEFIMGLTQTLATIESNLIAQVFGDNLPLLGDHLASAAANGIPALHFVSALQNALTSGLSSLTGAATYTEAQVEQALLSALNAVGITSGAGPQLDLTNPNDILLTMSTSKSFAAFDAALDTGFGLPGLGLQAAGTAHNALQYTLNFSAGLDTGGFYLNTANASSVFNANFSTNLTGLDVAANLSKLHFHVTDESATDGDGVAPTSFAGTFAVDLLDPGTLGADNKLRMGELTAGADLLNATLTGSANVNLNLTSDLGTAVLPNIATDLNFNWNFGNSTVDASAGNSSFGSTPTIAFKNVSLGLGSFFNDFVSPVFDTVQTITAPLQPIVDVLLTEVGFLSELAGHTVTLLDVAGGIGAFSQETVSRLNLYAHLIDFINSVPTNSGNARIDLGDFSLGTQDPRSQVFDLTNVIPQSIRNAILPNLQNAELSNFLSSKMHFRVVVWHFQSLRTQQPLLVCYLENRSIFLPIISLDLILKD